MSEPKLYRNMKDLWLKFGSNLVSTKVWILFIATILLRDNLLSSDQWSIIVGGLFLAKEVIKPVLAKFNTKEGEADAEDIS